MKSLRTPQRTKVALFSALTVALLVCQAYAVTSEEADSIARKVALLGHRKSSGIIPDPGIDETLRLKCRPNHDQFKFTAFVSVEESPPLGTKHMLGVIQGLVEVYFTTYDRDRVWMNFDFLAIQPGSEPFRIPVLKNKWTVVSLDINKRTFYVISDIHDNPDTPAATIQRTNFFSKRFLSNLTQIRLTINFWYIRIQRYDFGVNNNFAELQRGLRVPWRVVQINSQ